MNIAILGAIIVILSVAISIQKVLNIAKSRKSKTFEPEMQQIKPSQKDESTLILDGLDVNELQNLNIETVEIARSDELKTTKLSPYIVLDEVKTFKFFEIIKAKSADLQLRIDHIKINQSFYLIIWIDPALKPIFEELDIIEHTDKSLESIETLLTPHTVPLQDIHHLLHESDQEIALLRIFAIIEKGLHVTLMCQIFSSVDSIGESSNQGIESGLIGQVIKALKLHHSENKITTKRQVTQHQEIADGK